MSMMEDPIAALDAWVRSNAAWAAPATFAIAFVESFPLVSILVPSTALLLTIGALIGAGLMEPLPVLAACALGGILGDAAGYWLARIIGARAVRRRLPRRAWRAYAWSVTVFRRWGWWAVFIGRFLGPMRAVAPLAAGVVGMRNSLFQSANILSALIWAPLMLMPGTIGGWMARQLGPGADPVMLGGAAALVALLWLGYRRLRPAPPAGRKIRATSAPRP